jgi:predicted XRE-type DNA-binding protein
MIISNLKEQVELHFGKIIAIQKDCNELSSCILAKTGCHISASTLRRLFGFLSTNSQPTRTTLDILCKYVGYSSWDSYQQSNSQTENSLSTLELWQIAKENALKLSQQFIINFISANQPNVNKLVFRKFTEDRISNLINSTKNATALIAPRGYGKTSGIIKWYEQALQKKTYEKDIIVLVPALELEKYIELDILPENILPSILGIPLTSNILYDADSQIGNIVVIFDSIENIDLQGSKTEKLFSTLRNILANTGTRNIKFIVSTRTSTWKTNLCKFCSDDKWLYVNDDSFTSEGANFPPLSDPEIQEVFDKTYSKTNCTRIFIDSLPLELKKTISHPYYLSVFINIYNPSLPNSFFNRIDLLETFISNHVWENSFSKVKSELINFILELTKNGQEGFWVKKNDISDRYPIHLKLGSNYYTAYNELLSFGIFSEELIENRFGALVRVTKLSSTEIFSLLIIHNLKGTAGSFTFNFFQQIESNYNSNPLLPNLINTAFQLAYRSRAVSALLPFFTLKPETLNEVFKSPTISLCIKKDDFMRRDLIPHFSKNPIAQKYLFENSIDFDGIANTFIFNIQSYQNAKNDSKSKFITSNLLSLSGILTLDLSNLSDNRDLYSTNLPPLSSDPVLAGVWFSNRFLASYFSLFGSMENVARDLDDFTSKQYQDYSQTEQDTFEVGLAFGLILSKNYHLILKRPYKEYITQNYLTPSQKALATFRVFGQVRAEQEVNPLHFKRLEEFINDFPEWCNFHPQIIAHAILAISYLYESEPEKANDSFQRAVEISKLAGYKLYEIKLVKNLSIFLRKLGEEIRAEECDELAKSLVSNSAIDYKIL